MIIIEKKYVKAVKAGLISALILIVTTLCIYLIVPFTEYVLLDEHGGNPLPDVLTTFAHMAGSFLIFGGAALLIVASDFLIGFITAWIINPDAKNIGDFVLLGTISGIIAHLIYTPFRVLYLVLLGEYMRGNEGWFLFYGTSLIKYVTTHYSAIITPIVLIIIITIICGYIINVFKPPQTDFSDIEDGLNYKY